MRRLSLIGMFFAIGCAHAPGFLFREVEPEDWVVAEGEGGRREVLLRSEFERQVELGLRERPRAGLELSRYGVDDVVELAPGAVRTFPLFDNQAASVAVRSCDAARIYFTPMVDAPVQTTEGIVRRRSAKLLLEGVAQGTCELLLRSSSGDERRVTVKVEKG